jgi:F-type H+-transporting ATPase subunit a
MAQRLLRAGLTVVLVLAFSVWIMGRVLAHSGSHEHKDGGPEQSATAHPAGAKHEHKHDPFEHLQDAWHWTLLQNDAIEISLPLHWFNKGQPDSSLVLFNGISKFMILEVLAACLIALIYIPLARRMQSGQPSRGAWDNAFESIVTFMRDQVAKPNLGERDGDKYLPFLLTLFLFILFNNLLGMIPFLGSATANIYVTGALALFAFLAIHGAAIAKMGFGHYLQSQWPHMEIPFGMGIVLKPMIFFIEMFGTVIKSGVLAVRLFANMFAGHTVLAMILAFIVTSATAGLVLWGAITSASVAGVVALSLLELFVAFLQSYIFVFLTALFMGMALHPQH